MADNVINVEKPNLRVTKNRDFGTTGMISCNYNPANRRIYQASTGDQTVYNWNHSNISEPENPANGMPEFEINYGDVSDII